MCALLIGRLLSGSHLEIKLGQGNHGLMIHTFIVTQLVAVIEHMEVRRPMIYFLHPSSQLQSSFTETQGLYIITAINHQADTHFTNQLDLMNRT